MIPWKKPEQFPEAGKWVVVLSWHWTEHWPGSMEIHGGETEISSDKSSWRACTCDYSGQGSWGRTTLDDEIQAWCYVEEFPMLLPGFLKEELEK